MKKNFLRIFIAVLLALVLCVSVLACTGNGNNDVQTSGEPASDTVAEQLTGEQPTEPSAPDTPDVPTEDRLTDKGDNTDQNWGNDIIA